MLGRRQIREKAVKTVYSFLQNPIEIDLALKNTHKELDQLHQLYLSQLNFLVALRDLAEDQIEIGETKFTKTDSQTNPLQKLAQNKVLLQLDKNSERKQYSDKNKASLWNSNNEILVKTFQKIIASKRFEQYVKEESSFENDQKFIGKLYLRYLAENEKMQDLFETEQLNWADDLHIANTMVNKTIGALTQDQESHQLIKMFRNQEDMDFITKLIRYSLNQLEVNLQKIMKKLHNWEWSRVATMDQAILLTAITELDYFPKTASRIIMNEYLEVAKIYSTDKSSVFVNGILDKYCKELNRD